MLAIRTRLAILLLCLMLAGCGMPNWLNPQYRAVDEKQVAADDQYCRNFGTQPGTSAYDQCRKNLESWRQAEKTQVPEQQSKPEPTAANQPVYSRSYQQMMH